MRVLVLLAAANSIAPPPPPPPLPRARSHWGNRLDVLGLHAVDTGRAPFVFGTVHVANLTVTCRSPRALRPAGTGAWDRAVLARYETWRWYDQDQRHILSDVSFVNCSRRGLVTWELITHSSRFLPDLMQGTTRVRYALTPDATRVRPTQNYTNASVAHQLQSWLDADGSASGRGRPTLMGSTRAASWWRLDGNCTARDDWTLWLCDLTPTRHVASATLLFDPAAQAVGPGAVGDAYCRNDAGPCPPVGSVNHVGWRAGEPMGITHNTRITGPVGGFGWYVRFAGGAPAAVNVTALQVRRGDALVLVLPYPPGTRFNISAAVGGRCAAACTPARGCLCAWPFREVASPALVREGGGDTFHFSGTHLYVRLTPQRGDNIGVNGTWGVPALDSFVREGVEIPPRTTHVLRIVADCAPVAGVYCALPSDVPHPPSPCDSGLQDGFDSCVPLSAGVAASASGSASATPSPSASVSGTLSVGASGTPSPSGTHSSSGTPSPSASPLAAASSSSSPLSTSFLPPPPVSATAPALPSASASPLPTQPSPLPSPATPSDQPSPPPTVATVAATSTLAEAASPSEAPQSPPSPAASASAFGAAERSAQAAAGQDAAAPPVAAIAGGAAGGGVLLAAAALATYAWLSRSAPGVPGPGVTVSPLSPVDAAAASAPAAADMPAATPLQHDPPAPPLAFANPMLTQPPPPQRPAPPPRAGAPGGGAPQVA